MLICDLREQRTPQLMSLVESVGRIVTDTETGIRPDGTVLYKLLKGVIPYSACRRGFLPARRVALAARIIGGMRSTASGAPLRRRFRQDGTRGDRLEVPYAPHLVGAYGNIAGSYSDKHECRHTRFGPDSPECIQLIPLVRAMDQTFSQHMPERFAAQRKAAQRIDSKFVLAETAFTTLTINLNFRTATHTDSGDLAEGFGCMTVLTGGQFRGCELAFPRYDVAIRVEQSDVLLFDSHEPHANLPLLGNEDEFERISIIAYLREEMLTECPCFRSRE